VLVSTLKPGDIAIIRCQQTSPILAASFLMPSVFIYELPENGLATFAKQFNCRRNSQLLWFHGMQQLRNFLAPVSSVLH
jgi:hypothetical protein